MDTMRLCKECGAIVAADAAQGLCPKCLLKVGLGSEAGNPGDQPKSSPPPLPAEIAKHFPQLEILELLGQGGMGMVYKARQPQLDRFVALKLLSPELSRDPAFAERFNREAKALARLNHPNVVGVYDFGKAGDFYYLIMEYVDGMNLRQLEQARKRLSPEEALAIVPKICDALQYAHDEDIVHRDIKPGNILIDTKGRVKIADFGLAKLVGKQAENFQLTQARMMLGTPQYMAPEQFADPQKVDHRADIYSLGVVFYEMLTGELPTGRFALPSEKVQVDVRLDEVVLRTLQREPERRYQHVSEVKSDVQTISGIVENLPPALRRAFGYEFRSRTTLFGLPLLHVAMGTDPLTGKKRVARGIFAFGDIAHGIVAFGGLAVGIIAYGGVAIGGLAFGGCALGAFSFGGLAIALAVAFGGMAVAPIALGGGSAGYLAMGGETWAVHGYSGDMRDPLAKAFFGEWAGWIWNNWFWWFLIMMASMGIQYLVTWIVRKKYPGGSTTGTSARTSGQEPSQIRASKTRRLTTGGILVLAIIGIVAAFLPRSPEPRLAKEGWQLWNAGQLDEAAAKFSEAVKLAPNDANAWNGLGWAKFNSGKSQEAEKAFQKVIELEPNHPAALNGLGQIYLSQRKYDLAETNLLKAAPRAPAAWYGLARLYLLQGKFEQAEKWAQNLVDSGQADELAQQMLKAAKAKQLSEGLRVMIEPPPAR
jgi:Flp pilus assembly protein TadD/tRNA A-37 threonylcarbamoyl transferase component Bud32